MNIAAARRGLSRTIAVIAASALAAGVLVASALGATPAQASVASDFNPSRIITDDLFYNGNAMSASQIQTFLSQRIAATSDGRCTIGDSGRKAGSAWGSTKIANNCLKDAKFSTLR